MISFENKDLICQAAMISALQETLNEGDPQANYNAYRKVGASPKDALISELGIRVHAGYEDKTCGDIIDIIAQDFGAGSLAVRAFLEMSSGEFELIDTNTQSEMLTRANELVSQADQLAVQIREEEDGLPVFATIPTPEVSKIQYIRTLKGEDLIALKGNKILSAFGGYIEKDSRPFANSDAATSYAFIEEVLSQVPQDEIILNGSNVTEVEIGNTSLTLWIGPYSYAITFDEIIFSQVDLGSQSLVIDSSLGEKFSITTT